MNQVIKEVEKQEGIVKKEALAFSDDVKHYAKNQMAMSFTDLYKASVPIILVCALVSLLFWEGKTLSKKRRERVVEERKNRLIAACFSYTSMENLGLIR